MLPELSEIIEAEREFASGDWRKIDAYRLVELHEALIHGGYGDHARRAAQVIDGIFDQVRWDALREKRLTAIRLEQ